MITDKINNKEKFIEKSNIIHNNKYDYSLVNYIKSIDKVMIICEKHGLFEQRASDHLRGRGCMKCYREKDKRNLIDFISDSKKIHKDYYSYDSVLYLNNMTKVKISCPIHGIFEQTPNKHINFSQGCKKCGESKTKIKQSKGLSLFLNECKSIHGNKYDYSLADYKNSKTKIKIICPSHGTFEQTPNNHISRKQGCSTCSESHGEKEIRNFLTKNNIKYISQMKFNGCVYRRRLRFDFYLPNNNICIEYNGEQHYKKYRFEKNDEKLKIRITRDTIKKDYCLKNNIYLYIIGYDESLNEKMSDIKNKIYNEIH